jgi:hypothetical protein
MPEPVLIGLITGTITVGVTFAGFWMTLGGRITKAQATADNAERAVADHENEVRDMRTQVSSLSAAFSVYREQALEKFVTHKAVTEMEKRVIEAQAKSEQRMADAFDQLTRRIDKLIDKQGRD